MTARKSDYDTVLQWFVDLQPKAEKQGRKFLLTVNRLMNNLLSTEVMV